MASNPSSPTDCATCRQSQALAQLAFKEDLAEIGKMNILRGMGTIPDIIFPLTLNKLIEFHKLTFNSRTHCPYFFFFEEIIFFHMIL